MAARSVNGDCYVVVQYDSTDFRNKFGITSKEYRNFIIIIVVTYYFIELFLRGLL